MTEPASIWTTMSSGQVTDDNADMLIESLGISRFITDETEKMHLRNNVKTCAETGNCDGMYELLAKIVSENVAKPESLREGSAINPKFPQQIVAIYLLLQRLLPATSPLKLSGINDTSIPSTLPEMLVWVDSWWEGKVVKPWKGNNDVYDPVTWKTSLEGTTESTVSGSTAAPVDVSGSTTAPVDVSGSTTAPVDVSGSATAPVDVSGSAAAPVDVSGSTTTPAGRFVPRSSRLEQSAAEAKTRIAQFGTEAINTALTTKPVQDAISYANPLRENNPLLSTVAKTVAPSVVSGLSAYKSPKRFARGGRKSQKRSRQREFIPFSKQPRRANI